MVCAVGIDGEAMGRGVIGGSGGHIPPASLGAGGSIHRDEYLADVGGSRLRPRKNSMPRGTRVLGAGALFRCGAFSKFQGEIFILARAA